MQNEEGKRLKLFMEREGIQQKEIAELIDKDQPTISKMLSGKLKVPLALAKKMHLKYNMNYSWFFHGSGTMKAKQLEQRKLMNDVTDILATLGAMMASQEQMRDDLNRLARDFYAEKN